MFCLTVTGEPAMMVLPAAYKIDMENLSQALQGSAIELATEQEFFTLFPDCEVGAMPPFGNVYGIDVYVAKTLEEDDEIAFNACSHTELIKMPYADFKRLAKPKVVRISLRH